MDEKVIEKLSLMDEKELVDYIYNLKNKLKDRVIIPVHHYQSKEIVQFADFVGDSYKLAVECSKVNAEFILFCGVLFMAEGASLLAKQNQKILIPEAMAGCPMADMVDINLVEKAYQIIGKNCTKEIVPIVYMNSYADLKSFCGVKNGTVCTSSNAAKIFDYYLKKDKIILFFPDYYLGKNTAKGIKIDEKYIVKINRDLSFETKADVSKTKIFLWDGYCPIHQRFTSGDISCLREKYPDIKIIVHPECTEKVVEKSDISGSTEMIYKLIKDSSPNSVWGVGTETVFVNRLATDFKDKVIIPLRDSVCKNMAKITLKSLALSFQSIDNYINKRGKLKYEITTKDKYKINAKKSLEKMIEIIE